MAVRVFVFALICALSIGLTVANAKDEHTNPPWVIADIAPPFVQFDPRGQLEGIAIDYVYQVLFRAGIDAKILTAPWPRIAVEAKSDKNVLAFAVVRNAERENLFHWITPLTKSRHQLFARAEHGDIATVEAINIATTTAVLMGDYRQNLLANAGKTYRTFESWSLAVEAFARGQTDYLFASQGIIDSVCQSASYQCPPLTPVYTHSETTTYLVMSKSTESTLWVPILKQAAEKVKRSDAFKHAADQWTTSQQDILSVHFDGVTFNLWDKTNKS